MKKIETFLKRQSQRMNQNLLVERKGCSLIRNEDVEECLHEIHNPVATPLALVVATESPTVAKLEGKLAAAIVPTKRSPTAIEVVPAILTSVDRTSPPSSEISAATVSSTKKRKISQLPLVPNKKKKRTTTEEYIDIITTTAVRPMPFVAVPPRFVKTSVEKVPVDAKVPVEAVIDLPIDTSSTVSPTPTIPHHSTVLYCAAECVSSCLFM